MSNAVNVLEFSSALTQNLIDAIKDILRSRPEWNPTLQQANHVLMPVATTLSALDLLLSGYVFLDADNRNREKLINVAIALVWCTVSTLFWAGLITTLPGLIVVLSLVPAYQLLSAMRSAYRWWKMPDDHPALQRIKKFYQAHFLNQSVSAIITLATIAAFVLSTLPVSTFLISIAWTSLAALLISKIIWTICKKLTEQKSDDRLTIPVNTPGLSHAQTKQHEMRACRDDYYFAEERILQLTGYLNQDRDYLIKQIFDKQDSLRSKLVGFEHQKIAAKLKLLEALAGLLCNYNPQESKEFNQVLWASFEQGSDYKHLLKAGALQSFFKHKSDMGDIVDAVKRFFEMPMTEENEDPQSLKPVLQHP